MILSGPGWSRNAQSMMCQTNERAHGLPSGETMNKIFVAALIALAMSGLNAQSLQHPWSVTDGGGGKSSGSGFILSGSLGQPAAGNGAGVGFNEEGGYIPGLGVITGTTSTLNGDLLNAWNLVSVPFVTDDMRKTTLYSTSISNAFIYGATGYLTKDTLRNGVAYWLKFPSA